MSEKSYGRCRVTVKPDRETGWKLVIDDDSCLQDLSEAKKSMGVHARSFLKKRIETDNPKIKELLDKF